MWSWTAAHLYAERFPARERHPDVNVILRCVQRFRETGSVIGSFFLSPRLTREVYTDFLENELPALLENISLRERRELIFQHNEAPAHFSRQVRDVLDTRYPDKWMGRGGPRAGPARSLDLNMLDYFIWGHIKDLVEHIRNGTEAEAREVILAAFNIYHYTRNGAPRDARYYSKSCLRKRGRHFEQFLH
ncbi:hypothetical protein ALC60_13791 [Trachymyrmex zeteki]|uniref:DUF4817 domain-containing protein n=1 Tax=Mycetomoellerius zeteki TaxID=64791 RepID=A0A151WH28_9HYME|nr:hypothetical protein ALC60_13791 [Trachymyrmex zeteki]